MPYKDPEAKRANDAAYRAAHRAENSARCAAYQAAHCEEIRARKAAYQAAHREELRAYNAAYHAAHREEALRRMAAYGLAHKKEATPRPVLSQAERLEKTRARTAAYRLAHREERRLASLAYRAAHREAYRTYEAAYQRAHPEQNAAKAARRRAARLSAPVNDFTEAQWRELQAVYNHCCAYCERPAKGKLEQDHITPLSKGGSHTLANIVPACRFCNGSKHVGPPKVPVQPLLLTLAPRKP